MTLSLAPRSAQAAPRPGLSPSAAPARHEAGDAAASTLACCLIHERSDLDKDGEKEAKLIPNLNVTLSI